MAGPSSRPGRASSVLRKKTGHRCRSPLLCQRACRARLPFSVSHPASPRRLRAHVSLPARHHRLADRRRHDARSTRRRLLRRDLALGRGRRARTDSPPRRRTRRATPPPASHVRGRAALRYLCPLRWRRTGVHFSARDRAGARLHCQPVGLLGPSVRLRAGSLSAVDGIFETPACQPHHPENCRFAQRRGHRRGCPRSPLAQGRRRRCPRRLRLLHSLGHRAGLFVFLSPRPWRAHPEARRSPALPEPGLARRCRVSHP